MTDRRSELNPERPCTSPSEAELANCTYGGGSTCGESQQRNPLLDLPLPVPHQTDWITAYRRWARD